MKLHDLASGDQKLTTFKNVVSFDKVDQSVLAKLNEAGLNFYNYDEVLEKGKANTSW